MHIVRSQQTLRIPNQARTIPGKTPGRQQSQTMTSPTQKYITTKPQAKSFMKRQTGKITHAKQVQVQESQVLTNAKNRSDNGNCKIHIKPRVPSTKYSNTAYTNNKSITWYIVGPKVKNKKRSQRKTSVQLSNNSKTHNKYINRISDQWDIADAKEEKGNKFE